MKKRLWMAPAAGSLVFLLFSLRLVAPEGYLGFVGVLRTGWGAQIGLDLMNSIVVALVFASPVARRYGVRPWPWIVVCVTTGSVGLFAFAARILYAREAGGGGAPHAIQR